MTRQVVEHHFEPVSIGSGRYKTVRTRQWHPKPKRQRKADVQVYETIAVLLAIILAGLVIAAIQG